MEDIRDMRRSDWHRILERDYTVSPCSFLDMEGVVSLLQIRKVTEPLLVPGENEITFDNTITSVKITPRWWRI